MSVLDQLRDVERQLVARLRELEPMVREYEELRVAAERLGVGYQPRSDAPEDAATAAKGGGTSGARARRRATAAPGQRQQEMLDLVSEHPGITVAEIARRLGVDASGLYRFMHRLTKAGAVRKDGRRLYPVSANVPQASGDGRGVTKSQ